jgi:hypothetical protein
VFHSGAEADAETGPSIIDLTHDAEYGAPFLYWEVITEGNRVESRGVAETEPGACQAATEAARKAKLIA